MMEALFYSDFLFGTKICWTVCEELRIKEEWHIVLISF